MTQRLAADVPEATPAEDREDLLETLQDLPQHVDTVLETSRARVLAREFMNSTSYFFIGNGFGHSVASRGR